MASKMATLLRHYCKEGRERFLRDESFVRALLLDAANRLDELESRPIHREGLVIDGTKILGSALLAIVLTSTVAAHAEPKQGLEPGSEFFSTYFAFSVRGGPQASKTLDTTPTARIEIALPSEFAGWRCYRTPESSTKQIQFENVACWHGEFTTGISVACHNDRESHDTKSFFLRAPSPGGTVEVQISGGCVTTLETVRYDDGF